MQDRKFERQYKEPRPIEDEDVELMIVKVREGNIENAFDKFNCVSMLMELLRRRREER